MRKGWIWSLAVGVGLSVVVLTGCESPQERAQKRGEAFARLPKAEQEAALEGRVFKGMSADGVYVALGQPARVEERNIDGKRCERWVYTRFENEPIPGYDSITGANGSPIVAYPVYSALPVVRMKDDFEIIFEGGRAIEIQQLESL